MEGREGETHLNRIVKDGQGLSMQWFPKFGLYQHQYHLETCWKYKFWGLACCIRNSRDEAQPSILTGFAGDSDTCHILRTTDLYCHFPMFELLMKQEMILRSVCEALNWNHY